MPLVDDNLEYNGNGSGGTASNSSSANNILPPAIQNLINSIVYPYTSVSNVTPAISSSSNSTQSVASGNLVQSQGNGLPLPFHRRASYPQRQDISGVSPGEFRAYWGLVQEGTLEFDPSFQRALETALNHEPQLVSAVTRYASPEVAMQVLFSSVDIEAARELAEPFVPLVSWGKMHDLPGYSDDEIMNIHQAIQMYGSTALLDVLARHYDFPATFNVERDTEPCTSLVVSYWRAIERLVIDETTESEFESQQGIPWTGPDAIATDMASNQKLYDWVLRYQTGLDVPVYRLPSISSQTTDTDWGEAYRSGIHQDDIVFYYDGNPTDYNDITHVAVVKGWGMGCNSENPDCWQQETSIYPTYDEATQARLTNPVPYVVDRGIGGETSALRSPHPYNVSEYTATDYEFWVAVPDYASLIAITGRPEIP